ncbi:hypothetical protein SAMN05421720_101494 [Rhodospira trueperi]|uniref:Uncharacterized protein n=2 Tax=Rhodospira trueperi TaxID=69960 RepID=A0A1G6XJ18_9PROT|nr:hypothetical protein SAMN05421720_101494 [Rhodospira trueperi]
MRIHRAKRALLEDLSDEDKFLLRIMAHQVIGGGGDKPPDERPPTDTSLAAPRAQRHPDKRDR